MKRLLLCANAEKVKKCISLSLTHSLSAGKKKKRNENSEWAILSKSHFAEFQWALNCNDEERIVWNVKIRTFHLSLSRCKLSYLILLYSSDTEHFGNMPICICVFQSSNWNRRFLRGHFHVIWEILRSNTCNLSCSSKSFCFVLLMLYWSCKNRKLAFQSTCWACILRLVCH